ncbi:hypothetical protein MQX03_00740 [Chryseobacterium aahli]|uniref:hypothetical protein n=1 Tax=Chryseobacterium aahli TaxID=1278643 RepID=UPI001F5FF99D|nr:hypothetical protein [Chryseobacterium aahli]MCI3935706.1 hypothetical protein [Chryseobacterium aahli]
MKFLDPKDWQALKIIEVKGDSFFPFTAYFPYIRKMDSNYYKTYKEGDELDKIILETIKRFYPDSFLSMNAHIYAVNQVDDYLKHIETGHKKDFTIQFSPEINYEIYDELIKGNIFSYPMEFNYRLTPLSANHERIEFLHRFFLCHINNEKLKGLVDTILPI